MWIRRPNRMARKEPAVSLLELPDECLLTVLQFCAADDQRSVFSAARAHSRLHQAALEALTSITAVVTTQQQLDSTLDYLELYTPHINSLELTGNCKEEFWKVHIWELVPTWQLDSLLLDTMQLTGLTLQLKPCSLFTGVLGAAAAVAALTKLVIRNCDVPEGCAGLAAALPLLPVGLQHLSLDRLHSNNDVWEWLQLPTAELQRLQQLTFLELGKLMLRGPDKATPPLQPLQALTRLVDLRVLMDDDHHQVEYRVPAGMLSGTQHLTRLQLLGCSLEPDSLAGLNQLQHLHLKLGRKSRDRAAGAAQAALLLSQLQPLQQLTFLSLPWSLKSFSDVKPPAAAYAALTASSKLQHLDISWCYVPAGAWQHIFPAGRQLPHLQSLDITYVTQPKGSYGAVPDFSRLVSCCPGLQHLYMGGMHHRTAPSWFGWGLTAVAISNPPAHSTLAPLQGLTGLHTLRLATSQRVEDTLEDVCQLTGLRELHLYLPDSTRLELHRVLMAHLTQLTQLTSLSYHGPEFAPVKVKSEAPGDEPMWSQLVRHHSGPKGPTPVWPGGQWQ